MIISTGLPDLRTLLLVDGQVFANFTKHPDAATHLVIGSAQTTLTDCPSSDLDLYATVYGSPLVTQNLQADMRSIPGEQANGDRYAIWVNDLSDWTLSGSQTLQLMITEYNSPCVIECNRSIRVDADHDNLFFQARLGIHRANAVLRVNILDPDTGGVETRKVPFATANLGGKHLSGYQEVMVPLPRKKGFLEVTFAVEYQGYVDDGAGIEPFIFLADIRVDKRRARKLSEARPLFIYGDYIPSDGVWMSAPLPHTLAPEQTLHVRQNRKSVSHTAEAAPKITVEDEYGHTLVIQSQTRCDMVLYVDGKPDQAFVAEAGHTPVRLSECYFDGNTHHVSLRDPSGSISYWASQCLVPALLTPTDILQRETNAPFPDAIFAQTGRRYAALKDLLARADAQTDFAQLSHALTTLEGGYERVKLKPLSFPEVDSPDVSIVIPAHNKVEVTYLALCSLLLASNTATFEVIVVDDASTDETAELESFVSGITVIHNAEAQRFIRACNAGADKARGKFVLLLNNDVEVTTGWLDELIAGFERFDNVGLVGSKLLYPNGQLQDAGGIIWGSGNPWNYGNRQNPNAPRFCYARQADYLSGAALMTSKAIWDEVGGLSSYLEPMYFEDTDFSFKVREAGYSTWFIPSSVIYHYEGMTSGTDVKGSGFKRYQEVNRPKFKRRWAEAYANFGQEGQKPDLEKDRGIVGRVLFIDYTTPRPDQDAGSYAAIQEIKLVQALGYKVTFLPTNLAHLGSYTEDLQKMGVEVIYAPFYMSVNDYLAQHATDFDAFYITRFYVANDSLAQIRAHVPDARVLFNNADLHFLREIRAARVSGDTERMESARKTRDEEMAVIQQVDVVLSYNEFEHSVIEAYTEGSAKILRTPWVVDVPETIPPLSERSGLSFLGGFRHHPNAEGLLWFAREILPQVSARHKKTQKPGEKDLVLSVYGSRMSDEIKALKSDALDPVGFVQDAADAYDQHRVFVAPLLSGAGIKGKVLSALAHGVPCVLTPVAAEGIGLRHGHDSFIARTPAEWVDAIIRLNSDDALWQEMSENARAYMAESFSFERGKQAMRDAFEAADLFLPGAGR